jgi:hypothetical protein
MQHPSPRPITEHERIGLGGARMPDMLRSRGVCKTDTQSRSARISSASEACHAAQGARTPIADHPLHFERIDADLR